MAPFAAGYPDAPAVSVAVDVTNAQGTDFGYAQTRSVHGLQKHAVHGVRAAGEQTGDFFSGQQLGLFGRYFGHAARGTAPPG